MVIEDGRLVAEGHVVLEQGDERLDADALRLEGGELRLEGASLERDDVSARAASAFGSPEALSLAELRINPCACCATPPWSLSAQQAELREDRLVWRRGWFEIAGHRVLPVPIGRIPLSSPKVVPQIPVIGRGPDGFQVALPIGLQPTEALSLWLSPELRVERGPRLSAELHWAGEEARVHVSESTAWDLRSDALRGAFGARAAYAGSPLRAGVSGQWVGDDAWFADFGSGLMDRQVPWTRQTAYLALGPARVEWLGWQLHAPSTEGVPSLVLADTGRRLGPLRADSRARLDWLDGAPVAELGESASIYASPGPLELRLDAEGRGVASPGGLRVEGLAGGQAMLMLWAKHGPVVHELGLGLAGSYGLGEGELAPTAPRDPLGLAWSGLAPGALPGMGALPKGGQLGPALSSQLRGGETLARVELQAPWSPVAGLGLGGSLYARRGLLSARASGAGRQDGWFALTQLGLDTERASLGLAYMGERGVASLDQLRVAGSLRFPTGLGVWTPTAMALARPEGLAGWESGLSWEASCGCAAVGATVGFAEDREGPQISAAVSLRPGGR